MTDVNKLVESYFAPRPVSLTKQMLYEMFDKVYNEQKTGSTERQERQFVKIIESYATLDDPIIVTFGNLAIEEVIGALKVEGLAAYGKEPYTDVIIQTISRDYNLSLKGLDAPSLMGAGAMGIEKLVPGWLRTVTPKVVSRLQEMGFEKGDWITRSQKNIKTISRKARKRFGKTGKEIVFSGYKDNQEFPIVEEESAAFMGYPPYVGKITIEEKDNKIKIVSEIHDNEAARHLPDMFFKLGRKNIETLFAGTEEVGGPIDYIYKGPMDVSHEWYPEERKLIFIDSKLYDIKSFIDSYPNIYLRVRKRRIDQPFDPDLNHPILGKAIFGKGVISREGPARIVIADKISSKAEFGGEI